MLTIVILCYAGVVATGMLSVRFAHSPTLLTGRAWTRANVVFAVAAGLTAFGSGADRVVLAVLVGGLFVAPTFALRRRWFVFRATPAEVVEMLESSLTRVRVPFERTDHMWRLQMPGGAGAIHAGRLLPGVETLTFSGDWYSSKAKLALRSIAKRFESIVPSLTLRI